MADESATAVTHNGCWSTPFKNGFIEELEDWTTRLRRQHHPRQKGAGVAFENAQRVVLNAGNLDQIAVVDEPELMPGLSFERVQLRIMGLFLASQFFMQEAVE